MVRGKCMQEVIKLPQKKRVLSTEQKFWLKFLGGVGQVIDDFEKFKKLIDSVYNS